LLPCIIVATLQSLGEEQTPLERIQETRTLHARSAAMTESTRRFTDREVTAVLRVAADLDERDGRTNTGGLSQEDLRQIGQEVGISPGAIDRAIQALDRASPPRAWAGAPLVRKAVRDVPKTLGRAGLSRLLRSVDDHTVDAANVTEALGVVRWTAEDRFSSKQVSIEPTDGRTRIQVVEKARPRLRRIMYLLPAAWGMMLAAPIAGLFEPTAVGATLLVSLGLLGGGAAGRLAWTFVSTRSQKRVDHLASLLADEASKI
jgi:hypothetical protein